MGELGREGSQLLLMLAGADDYGGTLFEDKHLAAGWGDGRTVPLDLRVQVATPTGEGFLCPAQHRGTKYTYPMHPDGPGTLAEAGEHGVRNPGRPEGSATCPALGAQAESVIIVLAPTNVPARRLPTLRKSSALWVKVEARKSRHRRQAATVVSTPFLLLDKPSC